MTRLRSRLESLVIAALVGTLSAILWCAILAVVPWSIALAGAAAALLGIAALWRWMWTGHAVPPEGRR